MATGVGIDIGQTTTRVARVDTRGRGLVVTGYSRVATESVLAPDSEALRDALAAAGVTRGPAVVGVSGREVILKLSNYPVVPEFRLRLLVEYELSDLAERAGGDIVGGWHVLSMPPGRLRSEITVLLGLAKTSLVEERIALIEGAGLHFAGAVPNPVAAGNAFGATRGDAHMGKTVLVVDLGESSVNLSIMDGRVLIFARNVNFGGAAFVRAVADRFGVKPSAARGLLHRQGSLVGRAAADADPVTAKLRRAVEEAGTELSRLLTSSIKFAQAQTRLADLSFEEMVLVGGLAKLAGLDTFLGGELRIPTRVYDPAVELGVTGLPEESRADFAQDGPAAATAVGLAATAGRGEDLLPLRLEPERYTRRRDLLAHGLFVVVAAAAAFLAACLWWANEANTASVETLRRDRLRAESDQIHMLREELDATLQEREELLEAREAWATVPVQSKALSVVWKRIQASMPQDARLTGFRLKARARYTEDPVFAVEGEIRESTRSIIEIWESFTTALRQEGLLLKTESLDPNEEKGIGTFRMTVTYLGPRPAGPDRDEEEP